MFFRKDVIMNNYESNERRRVITIKNAIEAIIKYDYQLKKSCVQHLKDESKNDIWKVNLEDYLDNLCNIIKEHVIFYKNEMINNVIEISSCD